MRLTRGRATGLALHACRPASAATRRRRHGCAPLRTPFSSRSAPGLCAPLTGVGSPGAGLAACGAAAVGAGLAAARGRAGAALALLLLAAGAAGVAWGSARYAATAAPAVEVPVRVAGTVVLDAPPRPDGFGGLRARARVDDLRTASGWRLPGRTRLLLDLAAGPGAPGLGERVRVEGWMRSAASAASPEWWRAWLARQGIAGRLRPESLEPAGRRGGLDGLRDRWRTWASTHAGAGLSGDREALVRGMALGGGDDLSEEAATAFRDAGLWHLLAVSGQNVTVVALAALALLRALGARRRAAVGCAALVMAAYCLACDGGASVARAGIAGGLGLLAELRSAPRERWYLMLAGLAALLAHDPRAIGDPGLQLSFAAVAGLFLLAPPLEGWLRGWLPGRVAGLAAMAAAAGLATAPVTVAHFGRLSLVGLALNVVAVPLAAPVVILALLGMAAGALVPAAGVAVAWLAGAGAWVLLGAARWASRLPGAAVDLPGWAAPALGGAAGGGGRGGGMGPARRTAGLADAAGDLAPGGGGRGAAGRRRMGARAAAGAGAVAGGAGGDGARHRPGRRGPAARPGRVGGAVRHRPARRRGPGGAGGRGAAAGRGPPPRRDRADARLAGPRRRGAGRPGADAGRDGPEPGAAAGRLAPVGAARPSTRPAGAACRRAGCARGRRSRWGRGGSGCSRPGDRARRAPTRTRGSLVALATAGPLDVLLTADAESDALRRLVAGRVEVLKVSHHGSEDPGLPAELARLRPAGGPDLGGGGQRLPPPAPRDARRRWRRRGSRRGGRTARGTSRRPWREAPWASRAAR